MPPENAPEFAKDWRSYALRRNTALFLLLGWVPACVGMFLLSRYWLHQPELFLLLMLVWLIAALAAVWWAGEFRCPRCRRRFAALGRDRTVNVTRGLFDKICANCKMARFEQAGESGEERTSARRERPGSA